MYCLIPELEELLGTSQTTFMLSGEDQYLDVSEEHMRINVSFMENELTLSDLSEAVPVNFLILPEVGTP